MRYYLRYCPLYTTKSTEEELYLICSSLHTQQIKQEKVYSSLSVIIYPWYVTIPNKNVKSQYTKEYPIYTVSIIQTKMINKK